MPKISRIAIAKRNKSRLHIYMNQDGRDEYAFTVSEDVFIKRQLRKGMELSEEDVEAIREEDVLDKAFQRTLNYLSYRMRSKKEVLQYLKDQEVTEEDAKEMLDRLIDLNLLDDQQFAEAFVRTKKNTQKKGPKVIEQELYEKGVSQQIIAKAMGEYPEEEQLENAITSCEKKQKSYGKEAQRQRKQKLYQFLLQRGFTGAIAQEAVAHCEQEPDEDMEWEAINKQAKKAEKKFQKYEDREQEQRIKQFLYQRGFSMELIDRWLNEERED